MEIIKVKNGEIIRTLEVNEEWLRLNKKWMKSNGYELKEATKPIEEPETMPDPEYAPISVEVPQEVIELSTDDEVHQEQKKVVKKVTKRNKQNESSREHASG